MNRETLHAFAVAAPGLESLVAAELNGLGVSDTLILEGGVEFAATTRALYEANLHLRTASRVLVRLARFRAVTFGELERRARTVPWERVIGSGDRVLLRVTCRKSKLYHSGAVAERLARDIAERAGATAATTGREEGDEEPQGAQLVVVRLDRNQCTVSADSSGAHLHQRGYRTAVTPAPLRETLGAAMVIASGWDRASPLLDPFCGSGTIPIEAALIAARIAPGIGRSFRFMEWPGFDESLWSQAVLRARKAEAREGLPVIAGSDRSPAAVRAAVDNATRAGVERLVRFGQVDAARVEPPGTPGWVVTNPPYGVRLGDRGSARDLMTAFGRALRQACAGWNLTVLAQANPRRDLGIDLEEGIGTVNGGLRVHVYSGAVPGHQSPRDGGASRQ